MPELSAALVWPAIALIFVAIFGFLWRATPERRYLLGFLSGFLALAIAMAFHIAFVSWNTSAAVAVAHGLSSLSIIAIVWGICSRVGQRVPLVAMIASSLVAATLVFAALDTGKNHVALSVQNASIGLLFGMGAIAFWMARPSGVLDNALLWTISALAAVALVRPPLIFLLNVDVDRLVERQSDFGAVGLIIMTVLTVLLGLCLVALTLREALELRLGEKGIDPVSGFLDQRTFELTCVQSLTTARNVQVPACLAVMQLDWYQSIHHKWGAESTNSLIRQLSDIVREWQREGDILGRIAEDQFGFMIIGSGSQSGLRAIGKLRDAVDQSFNEGYGSHMKFTLSISLAEMKKGMNYSQLLVRAAQPLEKARAFGGNITFVGGNEVPSSDVALPEIGQIAPNA